MPWRPAAGGRADAGGADPRVCSSPAALLDYLRSCVAFEEDERGNIVKKIAGYHQFRAVRKARASVHRRDQAAERGDAATGKGGVVWHTQGSGKSLTMLMLAGTLVRAAGDGQPDDRDGHRPQRPGRPALRHLRDGPRTAAAGPGAGGQPRAPEGSCSTAPAAAWCSRRSTSSPRRTARSASGRTSS